MMQKKTGKVPTAIKEKPDNGAYEQWYIKTFFRLCSSRQIGMSVGPIPVSEITDYYNNYETLDDRETFLDIILSMDNTHLEYINSKKTK